MPETESSLNEEEQKKIEQQRKLYDKEAKKTAGKFGLKKEDVIRKDAELEDEARGAQSAVLEEMQNSSLTKWYKETSAGPWSEERDTIKGVVKDKKVEVWFERLREVYGGTINGKQLTAKDAEAIYNKYYGVAVQRTGEMKKLDTRKTWREGLENWRAKRTKKDVEEIK